LQYIIFIGKRWK